MDLSKPLFTNEKGFREKGLNSINFDEILTQELPDLTAKYSGYIGTENYHKHYLGGGLMTDGIKALCEGLSSNWITDIVFSYQIYPKIRAFPFQIWTLHAFNSKAVVVMREDSNTPVVVRQDIPYTDLPDGRIKLYLVDGVLLLPSEY